MNTAQVIRVGVALAVAATLVATGWGLGVRSAERRHADQTRRIAADAQRDRPLRFAVKQRVAIPADSFGASRLLTADLTGDGNAELIGINWPRAFVLGREQDAGWRGLWSGLAALPGELHELASKAEV